MKNYSIIKEIIESSQLPVIKKIYDAAYKQGHMDGFDNGLTKGWACARQLYTYDTETNKQLCEILYDMNFNETICNIKPGKAVLDVGNYFNAKPEKECKHISNICPYEDKDCWNCPVNYAARLAEQKRNNIQKENK